MIFLSYINHPGFMNKAPLTRCTGNAGADKSGNIGNTQANQGCLRIPVKELNVNYPETVNCYYL